MKMVAPTGFAPILNGSEPFVLLLDEGAFVKGVSIRPHWFSILYTWACNIRHTLPVLVAFSGFSI